MELTLKEKAIAIISNGIAVYSLYHERGQLPKDVTIFDFVLKATPEAIKPQVTAELIDSVFNYISITHNS